MPKVEKLQAKNFLQPMTFFIMLSQTSLVMGMESQEWLLLVLKIRKTSLNDMLTELSK